MKVHFPLPLVCAVSLLACGCGKVEPKKTASDSQPPKNAATSQSSTPAARIRRPQRPATQRRRNPKGRPPRTTPSPTASRNRAAVRGIGVATSRYPVPLAASLKRFLSPFENIYDRFHDVVIVNGPMARTVPFRSLTASRTMTCSASPPTTMFGSCVQTMICRRSFNWASTPAKTPPISRLSRLSSGWSITSGVFSESAIRGSIALDRWPGETSFTGRSLRRMSCSSSQSVSSNSSSELSRLPPPATIGTSALSSCSKGRTASKTFVASADANSCRSPSTSQDFPANSAGSFLSTRRTNSTGEKLCATT